MAALLHDFWSFARETGIYGGQQNGSKVCYNKNFNC